MYSPRILADQWACLTYILAGRVGQLGAGERAKPSASVSAGAASYATRQGQRFEAVNRISPASRSSQPCLTATRVLSGLGWSEARPGAQPFPVDGQHARAGRRNGAVARRLGGPTEYGAAWGGWFVADIVGHRSRPLPPRKSGRPGSGTGERMDG
eukprot:scaffold137_cov398-Prasinococcus_capsulatus_cf.AAC.26